MEEKEGGKYYIILELLSPVSLNQFKRLNSVKCLLDSNLSLNKRL